MEEDKRFKHLESDPRFKRLRKKQRKIEIDERFQSMFTDERFTLKYSKDKRGHTHYKSSGDDLRKYYSLKEDSPDEKEKEEWVDAEDGESEATTVIEEGQDDEEGTEDESNESQISSSSDETASDEELAEADLATFDDVNRIKYDWQPLDHDADIAETTTKRLAIQNLDWDRINSKDIYTLINSIRSPLSVEIYVSEFGKERLARERLEGPKEIVEMSEGDEIDEEYNMLKSKMEDLQNQKSQRVNEYEDADEELDPKNEEIRERIRLYQLSKLRYYYAVVKFDSVESAEVVYKELDGMEFEGSSLELDLRFIPDSIEFEEENLKEECVKLPDLTTYEAPQFISSALQQTNVKFTWDETDAKRQEKLHRIYTKEELERDDLDAYLASESDSDITDEEEAENFNDAVSIATANSEARVNKYKMLLKNLEEEENRKKKLDVDIEWDNFSKSESEEPEDREESQKAAIDSDSSVSDELDRSDNNLEPCKKAPKGGKKERHKKGSKRLAQTKEARLDEGANEELDLLVMDVDNKRCDEFKFNPEDDRFEAVYESALYNIDPSHPNFKRTPAFDLIAEKKRQKRRKTRV